MAKANNDKSKNNKKSYLESFFEKFRSKSEKSSETNLCNEIVDLESTNDKINMNRMSKEDFEARIANLETLIKRLETEIGELTTNVESSEEAEGQSEEPQQKQGVLGSTEVESVFSCTPCQINTVIVKDTNFTRKDLLKYAYNLPNLQNVSESYASNSVSDQEKNPASKDSDESNEYNENNGFNIKDYEINELDLKSETCSNLESANSFEHTPNNSNENLP